MRIRTGLWLLPAFLLSLFASTTASDADVETLWFPAGAHGSWGNLILGGDGDLYLSWIADEDTGPVFKFSRWERGEWRPGKEVGRGQIHRLVPDGCGLIVLEDGTTAMAGWSELPPGRRTQTARITCSQDDGESWSKPLSLPGDEDGVMIGPVSWAPFSRDQAALVWSRTVASGENPALDRGETSVGVFFTTVSPDGELGDPILLDPDVCGWCAADLAATGSGSLVVAYRDRSGERGGDITCRSYSDGTWSDPSTVLVDDWRPAICPLSGPAIAARGRLVVVAWLTAFEDQVAVFAAFSEDGGGSFGSPVPVNETESFGRPDVTLLPDGTARVVWVEKTEDPRILAAEPMASVRMRTVRPDGTTGSSIEMGTTGRLRESLFPGVGHLGADVYVVWTEGHQRIGGAGPGGKLASKLSGIQLHVATVH